MKAGRYVLEMSADDWASSIYVRAVRRKAAPSMTFLLFDAWATDHRAIAERWKRETERVTGAINPGWQVRIVDTLTERAGVES